MVSRLTRTLAIFRLALGFWRDSRRIARIRRSEPPTEAQELEDAILAAGAIRFRETALKLGGLIIKVGQFLSARTDLLPLAFTRELTQLQDQVPPAPWDSVRLLMQQEWAREPSEIFDDIEHQPVAAASLGQVHRAHLRDGREVAVKVQRPEIQRLAEIDLGALAVIMRVLERMTKVGRRMNATRLFDEFQELVMHELDYRQEADYLRRFRHNFSEQRDVVVPDVIGELTQTRVFVMEYVSGRKLTDADAIRHGGLDPKKLAGILIRAYLKQIAVDGFVQIDPHPGNFFADDQGRIIFLDFGMMAELPPNDLSAIVRLIQGILGKDVDKVVSAIDDLGFVRPSASMRLLNRAVSFLLDRLSGVRLSPGPQMDRAVVVFQDFLYHEPLEFPARYMFLGRAIGMLFGLVSRLDPDIDWMAVLQKEALPLLQERERKDSPVWIGQIARLADALFGRETGALVQTAVGVGWREVTEVLHLPAQLRRVLTLMERGDLASQPEVTGILRRMDRLYNLGQAQMSLMWAALLGAVAWGGHALWSSQGWLIWPFGLSGLWMVLRAGFWGLKARQRPMTHR